MSDQPALSTLDYLSLSFHPSEHTAILIRNPQRGEAIQRISTAARIKEPSFQDWLRFKNDREGFDIFVGMNPLKAGSRTRTKDDVALIRHLYVDLDHEAPASLAAIMQSNLVPTPNYVLSTSHERFQVVWRVEEISQPQAEALLRALARKFHGDPAATDSTRVLRLPGFLNRKYEAPYLVSARQYSTGTHRLPDFKVKPELADSVYPTARHLPPKPPSSEPHGLSQSEHDWAYAKRALARGTDPETVIQSIAEFREGEKPKPLDYARRTVEKAAAEMRGRPSPSGFGDSATPSTDDKSPDY